MIRLLTLLLVAVLVAGCTDPVNPRPDDTSDDDKKDPKQGYTRTPSPVPEPPAGIRLA